MADGINHAFISTKADSSDPTLVSASEWNDGHVFSGGANGQVLVFDTTQPDNMRWTDLIQGSMAIQNADNVNITGGKLSIGGHAPTGVLDVQGSVVASDIANTYHGARIWPVTPSGAIRTDAIRIEATTGASLATSTFIGLTIANQPTMANVFGAYLDIAAGTNRYNINSSGTAPNYFAGNVGIGNAAPSYALDVTGNARVMGNIGVQMAPGGIASLYVGHNKSAAHGIIIQPTVTDNVTTSEVMFQNVAGTTVGSIQTTAVGTAYQTTSDVRLKRNIAPLTDSLAVVRALRPVSFRWNADNSVGHGFLAHELMQHIPEAVTGDPDAVNDDNSIQPQQVDYSKVVPWLVGACQELAAQLQTALTKINDLELRLA